MAKRGLPVAGRGWAVRETEEAIKIALERVRKEAYRRGRQVQPSTPQPARHVVVFTTFTAAAFAAAAVLTWYRLRWQVALVVPGTAGRPAEERR